MSAPSVPEFVGRSAFEIWSAVPDVIAVVRAEHRARLTVRDHGIGIPPERQERIFTMELPL